MIDRNHFTEQAWNAIALSTQAAEELGHNYVGTEHLLVGLLMEEEGVAAKVLDANGVKADKVKELIRQLIFPNQNVAAVRGNRVYTWCSTGVKPELPGGSPLQSAAGSAPSIF